MMIAEQKYELLNIHCILLNIATIRQPYQAANTYILSSILFILDTQNPREIIVKYLLVMKGNNLITVRDKNL